METMETRTIESEGLMRIQMEAMAAAAAGAITGETNPCDSEEEFVCLNPSSATHDDSMEENASDGCEDDYFYDVSEQQNVDDDEPLLLPQPDTTQELSMTNEPEVSPGVSRTDGEKCEENNNDMKNTTAPANTNNDNGEKAEITAEADKSVRKLKRHLSPWDDYSNIPSPTDSKRETYILNLISKINLASITIGIKENPKLPISKLKLWDLIPENERIEYPSDCSTDSGISSTSSNIENPVMETETENDIATGTSGSNVATTINEVKREPADDNRIVECKKSSSESDISISQPTRSSSARSRRNAVRRQKFTQIVEAPPPQPNPTISNHQQAAAIPQQIVTPLTTNVNHRGAIPKVRNNNSTRSARTMKNKIQESQEFNELEKTQDTNMEVPMEPEIQDLAAVIRETARVRMKAVTDSAKNHNQTRNQEPSPSQTIPQAREDQREYNKDGQEFEEFSNLPMFHQQQPQQQSQNTNRVVCMEIYSKLRNLFPTVDRDYIRKLCPSQWGPGDHQAQMASLVEHLLERGDSLPTLPVGSAGPDSGIYGAGANPGDAVHIYETLLAIVPDADTEYLRRFAEENAGNLDAVETFLKNDSTSSSKKILPAQQDQQQHNNAGQALEMRDTLPISQQQQEEYQQGPQQRQQQRELQQQQQQQRLKLQMNTERVICMEIYRRLRNVFPNVDPEYIIKVCPSEWGPGDREAQIASLVERLIETDEDHLLPTVSINAADVAANYDADKNYTGGPDHIYETILALVPDADPDFLIKFAEDNADKPDAVAKFATDLSHSSLNIVPAQEQQIYYSDGAQAFEEQEQQPQNNTRVICMDIYCRLRSIFPNVDPDYIRNLCPSEWGPGDRDAQLAPLVEHLLRRGHNPNKISPDVAAANYAAEVKAFEINCIYETVLAILPDADPEYLRKFAEKMPEQDEVKAFVMLNLEKGDYPTRVQYMTRMKISQEQKRYTSGFDIKHFLDIIPDPFKHFMDRNRTCKHNNDALEFLKTYFNEEGVATVTRFYQGARYNLSQAVADLERYGSKINTDQGDLEIPPEDLRLLQEIAFIKHKKEIYDYMENVKRQEEAEFQMLKEQNFLIECLCCYDEECVPSKCSSCEAGHIFCNNCVLDGATTKMGEGETRIGCFGNCESEFSLATLQQVLPPTTFSILLKKRQAAEVIEAGLEGLVACPFCHFASIPPEGDKIFKCLNPECTKETCRLCKELSHVPLKCDEVMKTDKARRFIEEKMTQALARKCYKCKRAYFKEDGCNKITCPCGAMMCYICDAPITQYSHFRGQGSAISNLCPLYTDTRRMDAAAVREVARQAEIAVMKLNPNMKLDTTGLVPALPARGPYAEMVDPDQLTEHAQRVLDFGPDDLNKPQ